MITIYDRVEGILFGLAAGDRIGGPLQMALCLAESLRERQVFDPLDVGMRYLRWWKTAGFDTGPVAENVLKLAHEGMTFDEASEFVHVRGGGLTAGCNPAHRVAPLSMAAFVGDDELGDAANAEAALTHRHPLSGDVAAAVVLLCRALILGRDWDSSREWSGRGRLADTLRALAGVPRTHIVPRGFAPEVLAAAVRIISDNSSFPAAMSDAIHFAGTANYYAPVLVGCVGGAMWGRSAIPDTMFAHHAAVTLLRVEAAAVALAKTWDAPA